MATDNNSAHRVATAIELDIISRGWPVGENLGIESELAAQYGVGRDLLRQALTLVVRSGLATVKRGGDGGLIVTAPSEANASTALTSYLELSPLAMDQVLEARRQFEDLALILAIRRQREADRTEFFRLYNGYSRDERPSTRLDFVAQMLAALVSTTRNTYLSLLARTLVALSWSRFRARDHAALAEPMLEIAHQRSEQLQAVIACDVGSALAINGAIYSTYRQLSKIDLDHEVDPTFAQQWAPHTTTDSKPLRLGDRIATDIKRRLARGELKAGDRLGSEKDLMARYGVGRGAVRDATRILEQLSVAAASRGSNGGIYVTRPKADSVLRTVGLYLRATRITERALMEVGGVLDLYAAELACNNYALHSPSEIRRIWGHLEKLQQADNREIALSFYLVISELAASPLLKLLLPLQASFVAAEPADPGATNTWPRPAGDELLLAIQSGNPMLARSAMAAVRRANRFDVPPPEGLASQQLLALLDD